MSRSWHSPPARSKAWATTQKSLGATDACGASGWQALIGEHRDVLAAMTFPAPMRVYGPDDAVTMDYSPERLNVIHDEDGIITRVECG
ncbi:I78 family peptidase inhibitor [Rhodophyticola porphyridii]|uniref:I78 family peptidase inhibitor n=1 Tax=Rhodophyticola porphyridii TaxID=1852017 RepID=UPI0035CEA683